MFISRHIIWAAIGGLGLLSATSVTASYGKDSPPSAAAEQVAADKVNLNTATEKELEELPGIGQATARKIVAGRPYKSVDDLASAGISEKEIARITPLVTVARNLMPQARGSGRPREGRLEHRERREFGRAARGRRSDGQEDHRRSSLQVRGGSGSPPAFPRRSWPGSRRSSASAGRSNPLRKRRQTTQPTRFT